MNFLFHFQGCRVVYKFIVLLRIREAGSECFGSTYIKLKEKKRRRRRSKELNGNEFLQHNFMLSVFTEVFLV